MNKDFVVEFVRLIPRPLKTKTNIQLVNIVENGSRIDLGHMFTDEFLGNRFLVLTLGCCKDLTIG